MTTMTVQNEINKANARMNVLFKMVEDLGSGCGAHAYVVTQISRNGRKHQLRVPIEFVEPLIEQWFQEAAEEVDRLVCYMRYLESGEVAA